MSAEREFDDYVKKELGGFSPMVSPRVWENIVAERSKRKPAGFWVNFFNAKNMLLLTGSLIVATTATMILNKQSTGLENKQATAILPTDKAPVSAIEETAADKKESLPLPQNVNKSGSLIAANINTNTTNIPENNKKIDQQNSVRFYSNESALDATDFDPIIEKNIELQNTITSAQTILPWRMDVGVLQNLSGLPAATSLLQRRNNPNITIPGCPTVEEAAAGNKRYVEMYVGPDFTLRNFTDTSQSEYLQKRKASTEVSSAYSAGLRYTRVFSNGMSIKAGLNYSQINEKFTFVQSNLVQVTYIIDPVTGDTTGSYTITGTRKKTTFNKYRTLDIPLLMGYELGNGRLHVNINAGAMVNLYSWQRGEVLDTNFLPVSITTGKSTTSPYQFRTNVGVGITGGVGVYYKLTDQLHVLAEPYFRYNLQPMSKQTLTLQQKYNTAGIRFGVRLDLK